MSEKGPYTVKEMSKMLGRSDKTVYRMISSGKLKGYKELDTWKIFLPSSDKPISIRPDMSIKEVGLGVDITSDIQDSVQTEEIVSNPASGQFFKGFMFGIILLSTFVGTLMILGLLKF